MTTDEAHFAALEGVFYAAPINEFFSPTIHVEYGAAQDRARRHRRLLSRRPHGARVGVLQAAR